MRPSVTTLKRLGFVWKHSRSGGSGVLVKDERVHVRYERFKPTPAPMSRPGTPLLDLDKEGMAWRMSATLADACHCTVAVENAARLDLDVVLVTVVGALTLMAGRVPGWDGSRHRRHDEP